MYNCTRISGRMGTRGVVLQVRAPILGANLGSGWLGRIGAATVAPPFRGFWRTMGTTS